MATNRTDAAVWNICREVGLVLTMASVPMSRSLFGMPAAKVLLLAGYTLQYGIPPRRRREVWAHDDANVDEATAAVLG
jgi:hypothetical protein